MPLRHAGCCLGVLLVAWLAISLAASAGSARAAEPPTVPMLWLETGMHTAPIRRIGIDAANRYLVTGSYDKTVRVWELATGRLLRTLRLPIDVGGEGEIYAVAMSPDGRTVAAAGWTGYAWDGSNSIYLFDRESGRLLRRLTGLPDMILHLAYSRDGAFLVATLGGTNGMRLYRTQDYSQVASDTAYGADSHGADFDASGRLVTASLDGFVRLYNRGGKLRTKRKAPGGTRPSAVAFSPDSTRVAVSYHSTRVDVLSGKDLAPLYAPNTSDGGKEASKRISGLDSIAWSADGRWLYAGGGWYDGQGYIRRWAEGGRGAFQDLPDKNQPATKHTIMHILPLAQGGVVFGAADPVCGVLDATGQRRLFQESAILDFRDRFDIFDLFLARDGTIVDFASEDLASEDLDSEGLELFYARFALRDRSLTLKPDNDQALTRPVTTAPGLNITGWNDTTTPALNGTALKLGQGEISRRLAIAPDGQRFLLATIWFLRLFDRQGKEQWRVSVSAGAWGVNIAGNGQLIAAALGDGTIRWYRLRDGQELLALFPHRDGKRWVLWTPSGYYDAAPGAEELLGWHMNRGRDAVADFFPVSQFRSTYFRPDVVAAVLDTLDEATALEQANAAAQRQQPPPVPLTQRLPPVVQIRTPQDGATVSTSTVTVRFTVRTPSDEPVTAIKALVDGRPVAQPRRVSLTAPEETLQEIEVSVPQRDCEVAVIAENRYAASEPAIVRLRWGGAPAEEVPKPKLYVLAVGVSRYQDSRLALGFAAKDASDIAAVLQRQKGRLYRDVEVKLVTDATATKATKVEVLDALDWLERQTTSKDVAVLFLAGHGVNDRNGNYYFLPVDVDTERLKSTGIASSYITDTVKGLPGKVVVFLDTCHSGNIMGQRRGALDVTGVINELTSAQNGAVVFAASAGNQYSLENPAWGNGAFSKAVIEGLDGKADERRTGRITVAMLDLYVAERVKELTKGQQTPTTTKPHSVPDFPVALTP
jgi:WD40 repeat protein